MTTTHVTVMTGFHSAFQKSIWLCIMFNRAFPQLQRFCLCQKPSLHTQIYFPCFPTPCIARAAVQKRRRHTHLSKLENKSLLFGTLGNTQRHLVDSIAPTNSFCMVITINYLYLFLVIGEHSPAPVSEYYQRCADKAESKTPPIHHMNEKYIGFEYFILMKYILAGLKL